MTKKGGAAEAEAEVEGEEKEGDGAGDEKKTPAEIAAEERATAAEAKAAEAEAEANRIRVEFSKKQEPAPVTGYNLGSWSEAEWTEAEASTGKDRKAILFDLNQELKRDARVRDAVGSLQAQQAVREELQDALDADPLSPKFRGEVKKFISDIPAELMRTEEGRKKWISKAMSFGKNSVKIPNNSRAADEMGTKNTGKPKQEKGESSDMDQSEREVIESHGRTVEDYNKIKHPFLPDGIIITDKPEVPRFGPKT